MRPGSRETGAVYMPTYNESVANVAAARAAPPAIATDEAPDFLLGVGVGVDDAIGALLDTAGAIDEEAGALDEVAGAMDDAAGGRLVAVPFDGIEVAVVEFEAVALVASSVALAVGVKVMATTAARARTIERNCMVEWKEACVNRWVWRRANCKVSLCVKASERALQLRACQSSSRGPGREVEASISCWVETLAPLEDSQTRTYLSSTL
jgi:hypothetical protein